MSARFTYIHYLQKRARNDTKQRYLDSNVYGYLANGLTVLNSVMMWILFFYICLVGAVPINVTTLLLLKRLNDVNDVKYLGTLKLSVEHKCSVPAQSSSLRATW